uniref:Internal scaffolding protein n=1 Tax=Dulem virus 152 TaxID=3145629 RepID=A0AAU8AU47_9VIRU
MFKTQFDPHYRVPSNVGDPVKVIYTPQFDANGAMNLVESGRENIYDFIQSHAESVDIHVILERFARGDISALSRVQGVYGDFTTVPKTYAEMLNTLIVAENHFNSLSPDIREKFDNSFEKYIISMDNPDFLRSVGLLTDPVPDAGSAEPTVTPTDPPPAAAG